MKKIETFGEKLRTLRENKNMPLRKLAALLDIDQSTLSKIERDDRKPTHDLIDKISRNFNINKKELLITYLSDKVACELMEEEEACSKDILRLAEQKISYIKNKRLSNV